MGNLKAAGVEPSPQRTTVTWAAFLRSQAEAILAIDFIETITLTGQRQYILATIRNLLMDLEGTGRLAQVKFLIRDRDGKYPALINEILADARITTVLTGVRTPRMNSIMERWVKTLRTELLDRMLIWNEAHLRHALHEYQRHYNLHRTHRSLTAAAPLRALPEALEAERIDHLAVHRRDRLGGVIHEYRPTA
jgi:hypothetical protein